MKQIISDKCMGTLDILLIQQEHERQELREADARYEAARNYFMAEQTVENALELHRARMHQQSVKAKLEEIDRSLDNVLLRDFYTL